MKCKCGHDKGIHDKNGVCWERIDEDSCHVYCPCNRFAVKKPNPRRRAKPRCVECKKLETKLAEYKKAVAERLHMRMVETLNSGRAKPFRRWSAYRELGVPAQLLCGGEVVLVLSGIGGHNEDVEAIANALNRARVVLPAKARR